jgi:hypothetical protein
MKIFFRDRVSRAICSEWHWIMILLISASWVATIMGMSHWCLMSYKLSSCAGLKLWSSWSVSQIAVITGIRHSTWLFLLLVGLEIELRALNLQNKCSSTWDTSPVHFALVIFEMGVSQTIYLGWPPTLTLPICASQVASITSMSHWYLAMFLNC